MKTQIKLFSKGPVNLIPLRKVDTFSNVLGIHVPDYAGVAEFERLEVALQVPRVGQLLQSREYDRVRRAAALVK